MTGSLYQREQPVPFLTVVDSESAGILPRTADPAVEGAASRTAQLTTSTASLPLLKSYQPDSILTLTVIGADCAGGAIITAGE